MPLAPGDETTANEIYLVMSNDGDLHRQRVEPFIKNYARKMARGVYDHELAVQGLERNLVPEAVKRYKASNGDIGQVSAEIKRYIAVQWLENYVEDAARDEAAEIQAKRATKRLSR